MRSSSVVDQLIESKFAATPEQIAALAKYNMHGIKSNDSVNGVYLKCLIVGVQSDMERSVTNLDPKLVLKQVHSRYYDAVLKAVTTKDIKDDDELLKGERQARARERNRRSNFARSAKSTLLGFIKAEGDIMTLDAPTITKNELHAFAISMRTPRNSTVTLPERALKALGDFEEMTRRLADLDKTTAVKSLNHAMEKLAMLLIELGAEYTSRGEQAVREHKMLKTPAGVFWPIIKPTLTPLEDFALGRSLTGH